MPKKKPGYETPLRAMDEIEANIAVIQGVRQTLVDELADITRLTNEHIAICDQQIAQLRARKEGTNGAGV
jgi:flagellar biosynthesis regulator FlbT